MYQIKGNLRKSLRKERASLIKLINSVALDYENDLKTTTENNIEMIKPLCWYIKNKEILRKRLDKINKQLEK